MNNLGEVNGDVDVHLGDMVVAPDVFFITKDRLSNTTLIRETSFGRLFTLFSA